VVLTRISGAIPLFHPTQYSGTFTFTFALSNNNTMNARTCEAPATLEPFNVGPEVMHSTVSGSYVRLLLMPYFGVQSGNNATSARNIFFISVEWRHPKKFYCNEFEI
jgi:hypothetical protein